MTAAPPWCRVCVCECGELKTNDRSKTLLHCFARGRWNSLRGRGRRAWLGSGADADATNKAGLKPAGCVPAAGEGGEDDRDDDEVGRAGEGRAAARDELVALLLEAEGEEA